MTPERWSVVEELFARAADLDPEARAALLETTPGIDAELRSAVEELLAAHDGDPSFLEAPPAWLVEPRDREDLPERIGEYRIVRRLGRGGMGQVLLAEREAVDFRQLVALKVMRRGLDTDDLVRRFRTERQILASLDHPNIARLLDVGATEDGLPFFVMEAVEGTSIVEHCEARAQGVSQRLELFRTVCSAVHHAHQNLVVHRDLKPGNILVSDTGTPKLLDFGIAKMLDREGHDGPGALTLVDQRILTPEYAAPEQVRGGAVTTACDVYALGVLLYELLAGRHPHAHDRPDAQELSRRILHVDPPAPSQVHDRTGPARAVEPASLRGDLDTIVLRALRKEPEARYPSALSFAEDVHRYLEGLPVEARPATAGYRLGKFVRRNRVAVGSGVALFLLLIGFSGVTAYQSRRVREEAARVTRERDKAFEVRSFLLETFGSTGPDQPTGDTVTVRELLDRRAATLGDAFSADPDLHAEMTGVLAEAYEKLGLFAEAEPLARRALESQRAINGAMHADVASALNTLGWIQHQLGEREAAEATLREAVRIGRVVFPPEGDNRLARALNDLGVVLEARGGYEEAVSLYRESLDMRARFRGEGHVGYAVTTSNLAVALYRIGDVDAAVVMAEQAVAAFTRSLGSDHDRTMTAQGNLAALRSIGGDSEGAAEVYRQILERHRRVLGERHAQVAYTQRNLANQLIALGRDEEAETLLLEALAIERGAADPRDDRIATTLRILGAAASEGGRYEQALAWYAEALPLLIAALGANHYEVAVQRQRIADVYYALGRVDEAERDYRSAIAALIGAVGAEHYRTAEATLSLAELFLAEGRTDEARGWIERVAPTVERLGARFAPLMRRLEDARQRLAESASP